MCLVFVKEKLSLWESAIELLSETSRPPEHVHCGSLHMTYDEILEKAKKQPISSITAEQWGKTARLIEKYFGPVKPLTIETLQDEIDKFNYNEACAEDATWD